MEKITIAAAQSPSVPCDLEKNVQIHLNFIEAAHRADVDILMFPELSLCGYELPGLQACVVEPADARLAPLQAMAVSAGMTIIAGAAVPGPAKVRPSIGAIMFSPTAPAVVYRKRHLHPSEALFVEAGDMDSSCHRLNGESVALAICFDASHHVHAAVAASEGASLYLASVLISAAGYEPDASILRQHAAGFGMGVLLANHATPSGGFMSAGRSAFWNPHGELIVEAPGPGSFLVVADKRMNRWTGNFSAVDVP